MLFGKEIRYVLLFSAFAFIISVILGLVSHVYFLQYCLEHSFNLYFFFIGLLIEFIYKKYLYDLFKEIRFSSKKENNKYNKGDKYETREVDMNSLTDNATIAKKSESSNDFQFMEEFRKHNVERKGNKPSSNIQFSDKRSNQLSYVEANDPKIVAEAIKTLINKKE